MSVKSRGTPAETRHAFQRSSSSFGVSHAASISSQGSPGVCCGAGDTCGDPMGSVAARSRIGLRGRNVNRLLLGLLPGLIGLPGFASNSESRSASKLFACSVRLWSSARDLACSARLAASCCFVSASSSSRAFAYRPQASVPPGVYI